MLVYMYTHTYNMYIDIFIYLYLCIYLFIYFRRMSSKYDSFLHGHHPRPRMDSRVPWPT